MQNVIDPELAREFIREANAKIDAISETLAANPNAGTRVTIPAAQIPRPDAATPADTAAPAIAPAPVLASTAKVDFNPPKPERTDAEIYDLVGRFLDPGQLGPMFVSTPIKRRVYFGIYPTFVEILSSEKVLGAPPTDASVEVNNLWVIAGELAVVIKGYLWANDPAIEQMIVNAGDASKWPTLNRFWIANNRDPTFGGVLVSLWEQYKPWKDSKTPSEAELDFYWARNA